MWKDIKSGFKEWKVLLFLVSVFLFFVLQPMLEDRYAKYIYPVFIKSLFPSARANLMTIVFIVLFVWITYRKRVIITLFDWILLAWFFYYLLGENSWVFIKAFSVVPYLYLVPLYFFMKMVTWYIHAKRIDKKIEPAGTLDLDLPLGKDSQGKDRLGREKFAHELAQTIKNIKASHALAIGINGSWGTGKSSLVYLVKEKYEEIENNKHYHLIEYTPWFYNNAESLIANFLGLLEQEMRPSSVQLAKDLRLYAQHFANAEKSLFKTTFTKGLATLPEVSIKKRLDNIKAEIKRLQKKFIIIIDDLDRLSSTEIVEVLRLIRIVADFPNTVYLVAYDREYINKAIEKELTTHKPKNYLDKVFQMEFKVPIPDPIRIFGALVEHLSEKFTNQLSLTQKEYDKLKELDWLDKEKKQEWKSWCQKFETTSGELLLKNFTECEKFLSQIPQEQESVIDGIRKVFEKLKQQKKNFDDVFKEVSDKRFGFITNIIRNLRDVKRFSNNFLTKITLSDVFEEVNLYDFFLLELINYYNQKAYVSLYLNKQKFLKSYNEYRLGLKVGTNTLDDLTIHDYFPDFESDKVLKEIVKQMFGQRFNDGRKMFITSHLYFHKYFSLNLFFSDISHQEFSAHLIRDSKADAVVLCEKNPNQYMTKLKETIVHLIAYGGDFEKILEIVFDVSVAFPELISRHYDDVYEIYSLSNFFWNIYLTNSKVVEDYIVRLNTDDLNKILSIATMLEELWKWKYDNNRSYLKTLTNCFNIKLKKCIDNENIPEDVLWNLLDAFKQKKYFSEFYNQEVFQPNEKRIVELLYKKINDKDKVSLEKVIYNNFIPDIYLLGKQQLNKDLTIALEKPFEHDYPKFSDVELRKGSTYLLIDFSNDENVFLYLDANKHWRLKLSFDSESYSIFYDPSTPNIEVNVESSAKVLPNIVDIGSTSIFFIIHRSEILIQQEKNGIKGSLFPSGMEFSFSESRYCKIELLKPIRENSLKKVIVNPRTYTVWSNL